MTILARFQARSKSFFSFQKGKQGRYESLGDLIQPLLVSEGCKEVEEESTSKKGARRRLLKELSNMDDEVMHCSYGPVDPMDPFKIQAIIIGPSGTPFENGIFFLSLLLPPNYPYKPPKIKFHTKVFHPNITSDGTIEIDILRNEWSPAQTIEKVLLSICSFLADPNHTQDSCNSVCDLYWKNKNVYDKIARDWTLKYAMI